MARMAAVWDSMADVTFDCVLGDDENLLLAGQAQLRRGDGEVSYRFMEHYTMVHGLVAERRSYMDAVPPDVAAFFGS